jgi:hypothetical protein
MKSNKIRFLLFLITLASLLNACQPEATEPLITACLLTKTDALEVNEDGAVIPSTTTFQYNEKKKPERFSFYRLGILQSYDEVKYNAQGELSEGIGYDNNGDEIYTIEYTYEDKKLSSQQKLLLDNSGFELFSFNYDSAGRVSFAIQVNYVVSGGSVDGRAYEYEYDSRNNCTTRYVRFRETTLLLDDLFGDKFKTFLNLLIAQKRVVNARLSNYDNNFNPYQADPALAVLFDTFPSVNNAGTVSFFFIDTGTKNVDFLYSYQYNRRGFPFLTTIKANYIGRSQLNYLQTSSFEYNCQ